MPGIERAPRSSVAWPWLQQFGCSARRASSVYVAESGNGRAKREQEVEARELWQDRVVDHASPPKIHFLPSLLQFPPAREEMSADAFPTCKALAALLLL